MIGKWITTAWEAYKKNWTGIAGTLIAVYIVFLIVAVIAAVIIIYSSLVFAQQEGAVSIFLMGAGAVATVILYLLVGAWATAAILVAYRDALGGKAEVGKALSEGVKYYGRMFAVTLITLLITGILVGAGIYTLTALKAVGLVSAVILWLAALVVYLLLLWAPAYVVLEDMGTMEALEKSCEHTKKKVGVLLWFLLTTIILGIASAIISIIPVIGTIITILVVTPLIGMVYVQAAEE